MNVKDFKWNKGMSVRELVGSYSKIGFQSVELSRAADVIIKMRKSSAKIFLTFTSNMITSGLRGFFAQLIELGLVDVAVTTAGSVEEDVMKSIGEEFNIGTFDADDVELYEQGINRVGNLMIKNESYMNFEDWMVKFLGEIYGRKKRWCVSELLKEIGLKLKDKNSFLYRAARNDVPVFCPAITDAGIGFHLYLFQQKHKDFIVDVIEDFGNILLCTNFDEKKGVIALGGSISKHHAILCTLLNGGAEYAVYMTTAHKTSGSMSGATTSEAKSWGKVKDDSDIATVIGDVTIMFPLVMIKVLEELDSEGLLKREIKEVDKERLDNYKENVKS